MADDSYKQYKANKSREQPDILTLYKVKMEIHVYRILSFHFWNRMAHSLIEPDMGNINNSQSIHRFLT